MEIHLITANTINDKKLITKICPGSNKSICFEPCLWCGVGVRIWYAMVSNLITFIILNWCTHLTLSPDLSFMINPIRYPFDTQSCVMVFECEGNSGEFVQLVPQHLEYLGPKDLTQYFIRWIWAVYMFLCQIADKQVWHRVIQGILRLLWFWAGENICILTYNLISSSNNIDHPLPVWT